MKVAEIEVFADVSCPFAHVALRRLISARNDRGSQRPRVRVRAWPLELVNGTPMTGPGVAPKVAALRATVAPDLFAGFDPDHFPATTLPLLAAEAAAHRLGPDVGERFSLRVREILFDDGVDPTGDGVVDGLLRDHGIDPDAVDPAQPTADHAEGTARGVRGSPHFFAADSDWFCPSLHISHDGDVFDIEFDEAGFAAFAAAALG